MNRCLVLAAMCLAPSVAFASRAPDLETTLSAPAEVVVYERATYEVSVANQGTRRAEDVLLVIALPTTNNQPTPYVMGEVGAMSSRCALSGLEIVCDLSRIGKGKSKVVWFELMLPESAGDLYIDASASTSSAEVDLGDNDDSVWMDPANVSVTGWSGPLPLTIEHCTGADLTSFHECECAPSSITSHSTVLQPDGSITLPQPGFTGQWWSDGPDHLAFEYFDATHTRVVAFEGHGVSADCWEGVATFQTPTWVAPYSVCR